MTLPSGFAHPERWLCQTARLFSIGSRPGDDSAFDDGRLHLFVAESTLRRAVKRTIARAGHPDVEDDLVLRSFRPALAGGDARGSSDAPLARCTANVGAVRSLGVPEARPGLLAR